MPRFVDLVLFDEQAAEAIIHLLQLLFQRRFVRFGLTSGLIEGCFVKVAGQVKELRQFIILVRLSLAALDFLCGII